MDALGWCCHRKPLPAAAESRAPSPLSRCPHHDPHFSRISKSFAEITMNFCRTTFWRIQKFAPSPTKLLGKSNEISATLIIGNVGSNLLGFFSGELRPDFVMGEMLRGFGAASRLGPVAENARGTPPSGAPEDSCRKELAIGCPAPFAQRCTGHAWKFVFSIPIFKTRTSLEVG